ncbi:MAG: DUF6273 domain-containing protein [Treponema sp.]|nr:DUF6273 domain-containing protein [Treponema sp.]
MKYIKRITYFLLFIYLCTLLSCSTPNGVSSSSEISTPPIIQYTTTTYKITITDGIENGNVVANSMTAAKGETITLTATPSYGYVLSTLVVYDEKGCQISLIGTSNIRTFKMPAQKVTVNATFVVLPNQCSPLPAGTGGSAGTAWTYVTFGTWPQTVKLNSVIVDESETNTAGSFIYYKGNDGNWYAKIQEKAYENNYTYSEGSHVEQSSANSYKYFKVEPIKWRVLTADYNGKKLLLADKILVSSQFYDVKSERYINGKTVYANNYKESKIRAYLNGINYKKNGLQNNCTDFEDKGFFYTAFNLNEQNAIAETLIDNSARSTNLTGNPKAFNLGINNYTCEDTVDKIFLLSVSEVCDYWNSDEHDLVRVLATTDFAKANGVVQGTAKDCLGGLWWLRSPDWKNGSNGHCIEEWGSIDYYPFVNLNYGVAPALCLK